MRRPMMPEPVAAALPADAGIRAGARVLVGAVLLLSAPLVTACAPPADAPIEDDVTFEDERSIDLTGDGSIERVHVAASGPSHDALRIVLSVLGARDSLLYRHAWSSAAYLAAVDRLPADTTLQGIVRGHLTELLRDAAFAPPAILAGAAQPAGVMPDAEVVRNDIAEYSWRRSAGVPDTLPLPPFAPAQIEALLVAEEDVQSLVAELARQPSFTYHVGGQVAHTIAWSHQERRFIRIRSCC